MRGKAVFYPIGWDDNGLPTERRVQNYFGVRCDPTLPYDPELTPPGAQASRQLPVSRRNFVELCEQLTEVDERAFEDVWRRIGLSVDWSAKYRTIGSQARAISQREFLANLARGEAYLAEGPTLWDVTFQTAVAQADLEDREVRGAWHRIAFTPAGQGSGPVIVATTRPELLPACVALVAHPADERYAALAGTRVSTPVFGVEVPVLTHRLADPAKGTGLAMVCTFGDTTDIAWWRELDLPTRPVIGRDGRLAAEPPAAVTEAGGQAAYQRLAGLTPEAARPAMAELLREAGALLGEPEPVTHPVKFYEKGTRPLEIITTRQWFLRSGGRDPQLRAALKQRGAQIAWHPEFMQVRYQNWVDGLAGDWLISRQRFFGVAIPVWYPLGPDGAPRHDQPIVPSAGALPVDPAVSAPPGYTADQRGKPGGFTGDPDVMDTWATSSLTPQIAARQGFEGDVFDQVYPMDLRPQAHEIIRTWLFYTVLRAQLSHDGLPWRNAAISGWILDPDRKKMSKSKGNVVTPAAVLDEYGSDAVRYWAASSRLGADVTFDPGQLRIGRRLAIKILNASRFVLGIAAQAPADEATAITEPLDRAMLAALADVVADCTASFEAYEHARALERTEEFFWSFCDDYVELVKARGYGERGGPQAASAAAALRTALSVLLALFAPFLPFVTEEAWSWWQQGSVHTSAWPQPAPLRALASGTDPAVLTAAATAIAAVRKAKTEARVSMRAPADLLAVTAPAGHLALLSAALDDVRAAGHVGQADLRASAAGEPRYEVVLTRG
jgi:valyl-tRNA synthetase